MNNENEPTTGDLLLEARRLLNEIALLRQDAHAAKFAGRENVRATLPSDLILDCGTFADRVVQYVFNMPSVTESPPSDTTVLLIDHRSAPSRSIESKFTTAKAAQLLKELLKISKHDPRPIHEIPEAMQNLEEWKRFAAHNGIPPFQEDGTEEKRKPMNRRDELPEFLRSAYDEGYELAKARGWLAEVASTGDRDAIARVYAKQIGFIDGLKEIWPHTQTR